MATRVPPADRPPLLWLASLPATTYDDFAAATRTSGVARHPLELATRIQSRMENIEPESLTGLISVLTSMAPAAAANPTDFARDISQSEDLELNDEQRNVLATRLGQLLGVHSLAVTAKLADVAYDQPRNLQFARILTDLRPVFPEPVSLSIEAAAIVHTLKLFFNEGYEQREFFVAMDSGDLKALRDLLDRAEAKSRSLIAAMKTTGIQIIDGGDRET